ncbi:uncharacterized protein E0L32_010488 [Thyridium curvatum]|uniref:tRNA(Ile)-lysidine synthetase n=1 Tax=Thyridium curvatum TaxID=1093900 RepID=A0A507ASB8_9PEZI|nr:uncharacterized protein E0L32_010488 [Thyridium curvatum]TPX07801.1 hypothetical protein E0L32_010488 [Thyridium curvatum]
MSTLPQVLHTAARPIGRHEFLDALRATCPPRMPHARGSMHRPVALAISGGVDSMALAFLCARARRDDPWLKIADHPVHSFHALVIDHRLREGSSQEARAVARALERVGARPQVIPLNWASELGRDADPTALPNLESVARRMRYQALGKRAALNRYASMLFAHHEDDQYETVMMRLLAGHGSRGLRGIRAANDIPECQGIHGADRSGFIDDQRLKHPYFNLLPSRAERRHMRRALRNDIDPSEFMRDLAAGLYSDTIDPFSLDDGLFDVRGKSRKAPPLVPLDIEDLGVMIYRPLLEFAKDRLVATCEQNNVPWFEDHTNQDPTLTTRNALRYIARHHKLPAALQKPAILQLARRCDQRARMEEAEAQRLLDQTVVRDFQTNVGTVVIRLPTLRPRARRKHSIYSEASYAKSTEHYRTIAAILVQRLLGIVTPETQVTPATGLQNVVSRLFPSLSERGGTPADQEVPKAFTICGVQFTPVHNRADGGALYWYLSREPHVSPAHSPLPTCVIPALKFRMRWRRRPEEWIWPRWSHWHLYDGRFWIRLSHRFPFEVRVAPFDKSHAKGFRESLLDATARDALAAQLKKYAPGKVRYTLPALYTVDDIDWALSGKQYWLKHSERPLEPLPPPGDDEEPDSHDKDAGGRSLAAETPEQEEERKRQWRWEFDRRGAARQYRLLALPTLGVRLPGTEHWIQWEVRHTFMNALGFLNRPIAGSIWATRALLIASLLVFIPFIVQAQTREMLSDFATSVTAALFLRTGADASPAAPGSTDGAAALRRWYPPRQTRLNNLTNVVGDSGVYGFIFDSSATPDDQYGRYNWCNMPHVRRREYVVPGEEYELRYVELIHRHHKRTPYASNAFPVEPYPWDCDDQGLFYYARPQSPTAHGGDADAAGTYWRGYASPANPFAPRGWRGTCRFPQITAEGLDDAWVHGDDLYGVYGDLLGFLPSREEENAWRDSVAYRVTNNVITSHVAGVVVHGMWRTTGDVPLAVQAGQVDSLEPRYACGAADKAMKKIRKGRAWRAHLRAARPLFKRLDAVSGVEGRDEGFHESLDHYYDNLSARQCHGKPLPCSSPGGGGGGGKEQGVCVTQEMADEAYRFGQWEYSRLYRDDEKSLAASVGAWGVWVAELAAHLRDAMREDGGADAGKKRTLWYHNIAHDGSVSRLLSILQVDEMVWPGMGAEVVFELWRKMNTSGAQPGEGKASASGFYIRVLFGGQVLQSSSPVLGTMDMLPIETLLEYVDGLVGVDASLILGKCNGSIPL